MEQNVLTRDKAVLADSVSEYETEQRFNSAVNQVRALVKAQLTQPYKKEIADLKKEKCALIKQLETAKRIHNHYARLPVRLQLRAIREELEGLEDECTALKKSKLLLEQEAAGLKEQISALKSEIAALKDGTVARIGTSDWFKDKLHVIDEVMMGMEKDFTLHAGAREGKIRNLEKELKQEEERNAKRARTLESVKELIGTEN